MESEVEKKETEIEVDKTVTEDITSKTDLDINNVQGEEVVSTDNQIHDVKGDEEMVEGHHMETLSVYVNESQIREDLEFAKETESEKKERLGIISNSLEISNLEDQVDKELIRMVKVKDSEERIERLKELLSLLQGYTMSQDRGKDDKKKEEGTEKKCEKEDTQDKQEENKSSNMEEMKKIEESDERYVNEKKVKKDTDASELDINGVPERKAGDETNVKDETLEEEDL